MLNHLRKIHFYIVATSIALLTLTALLPQSRLDIAKEQLLALNRILKEVDVSSLINDLVLTHLEGGPSEHLNENAGIRTFFIQESLPEEVDPTEFEKNLPRLVRWLQ